MLLREHPGIVSKRDAFQVNPASLTVDPGFNVRDLDAPAAREALDELKASIREHGVQDPLEVRLVGENLVISSGHRRHKVVMELIAEGVEIKSIPAVAEPKGLTDAQRFVRSMQVLNDSEPLSVLEKAEMVRRLQNVYGWPREEIAKAIGVKTLAMVDRYLDVSALPEPMREAVREDVISATEAVNMVRREGPLLAEGKLEEAIKVAKERGKSKVTAKSISSAPRRPRAPSVSPAPEPPAPPGNIAKTDRAISLLREVMAAGYSAEHAAGLMLIDASELADIGNWLLDVANHVAAKKAA